MELNKTYNEDCLEGMKRIADDSVDMILTDLPYGRTNNKWDIKVDLQELFKQYAILNIHLKMIWIIICHI